MDWTALAHDREQWSAPVNTAMNLRVPSNVGEILEEVSDWWLLK
jgi:hypothetical protein